jgi:hypothetical protein
LALEEVVNFAEARSEAVQGAWIRHDGMAEGSYISYAFSGLRINFPHSSSGWTPSDDDLAADWTICGPTIEPTFEGKSFVEVVDDVAKARASIKRDKWGRHI